MAMSRTKPSTRLDMVAVETVAKLRMRLIERPVNRALAGPNAPKMGRSGWTGHDTAPYRSFAGDSGERSTRGPADRVRARRVSRRAGGRDPARDRRGRRRGPVPDRRRQVALLSDPGALPRRRRRRDLAFDRADAGPGRGAPPGRGAGGGAEFEPAAGRGGAGAPRARGRRP